jgi:hypothetical protein
LHLMSHRIVPLLSPFMLACSGPGAAAAIASNVRWSLIMWALVALACGISVKLNADKNKPLVACLISAVLIGLNPGWTISAYHGDCGYTKFYASAVFLAVAVGFTAMSLHKKNDHK